MNQLLLQVALVVAFGALSFGCGYLTAFIVTRNRWTVTIGGYVKDTVHADRVELNSAAVVNGDIFHRTLVIEGSDASLNRHAQSCAGTYRSRPTFAKLGDWCRSIRPVAPELEGLFCRRREWGIKVLNEENAFLLVICVCGKGDEARRFALKR